MSNKLEAIAMSAVMTLTPMAGGAPRITSEDTFGHAAIVEQKTVFDCENGPREAHLQMPLRKRQIDMVYGRISDGTVVGAGVEYSKKFEKDIEGMVPYTTNLNNLLVIRPSGEMYLPTPEVDFTFTRVGQQVFIDVNCNNPVSAETAA